MGLERKRKNDSEWNRLDAYEEAFHKRVRKGYFELAKLEPQRWQIIDASKDKDQVQQDMRQAVISRLKQ